MADVEYFRKYTVELMSKLKKNQVAVDSFTNENNFLHNNRKRLSNILVKLPYGLDKEFKFTFTLCVYDDKATQSKEYKTDKEEFMRDWRGETVFCNLSYCKDISSWIKKCYEESKKLDTMVVMFMPIMDTNSYFRDIVYNKARQVRFIRDDLKGHSIGDSNEFKGVVVIF